MAMVVKGVNGTISFDGRMVVIDRKGGMARATVGKGSKRIPVTSIAAVDWKPASRSVRGFISFTVPGGIESKARPGRRTQQAAKDENSVLFGWTDRKEFEQLRDAIELAITGGAPMMHAPIPAPPSSSPPPPPPPPSVPAGWMTDPTGRAELRYWDGGRWTEHVSSSGVAGVDPV